MQQSWISSADSSSKYRQPRSAVNNTSRATSPGPADHSKTNKNRSQDASIWRFLSIPFQNGLEALPRGLLETIFFEMYDLGCPTWGLKIAKRRDHLRGSIFFGYLMSSRYFYQHGGQLGAIWEANLERFWSPTWSDFGAQLGFNPTWLQITCNRRGEAGGDTRSA